MMNAGAAHPQLRECSFFPALLEPVGKGTARPGVREGWLVGRGVGGATATLRLPILTALCGVEPASTGHELVIRTSLSILGNVAVAESR